MYIVVSVTVLAGSLEVYHAIRRYEKMDEIIDKILVIGIPIIFLSAAILGFIATCLDNKCFLCPLLCIFMILLPMIIASNVLFYISCMSKVECKVCFQRLSGAYPKTFLPCFILGMLILVVTSRIIPDQNLSSLQTANACKHPLELIHRNRSQRYLPYRVDAYRMRTLPFVGTLIQDDAEIDRIINLPGLTFVPTFKQYSGFLPTKTGNYLHYWMIESQNNPSTDPLVLWFNGASGCNSLDGLLAQIGPFRVDQDGETLFENIYSWNKAANLIFLDSPYGVGYSYRNTPVPSDMLWNDDQAAEDNADALEQFFQRFKEYQNRNFYITGQGYAGVYGPTLVDVLLKRIQQNGNLYGIKLAGLAIGNGAYNEVDRRNSIISLSYYTGMLDKEKFESLTNCCLTVISQPLAYCNFSQFINWTTNKPIDNSECATKIWKYAFNDQLNNSFNNYQDCYMDVVSSNGIISPNTTHYGQQPEKFECGTFVDQGSRINIESTDAQHGFPCWIRNAVRKYLNLPIVREALHIPDNLPAWSMCNNEWFVTRLTEGYQESEREYWTFQESSQYEEQAAGYYQRFFMNDYVTIDFLIIKGAGHFTPLDRGGPSLQMLSNFVENIDYSISLRWNMEPKSILPQYRPAPKSIIPRQLADLIFNLPGLTYAINFHQYSGYLKASEGNYLHYWLVESQNDPSTDPLIIWFNGGPGCSSLIGLLMENGPFHPNRDGITLFENIFSWNKLANVLYIDSPRQVGFSYQDSAINPDDTFNDTLTAIDAYKAILDFFTIFPIFEENDLYVAGESYAGVYVPVLTAYMVKKIQEENVGLNLKGMIIGNGYLSAITDVRTISDYLYFHGFYGKKLWDQLQQCCPQRYDDKPTVECKFDEYIDIAANRDIIPKSGVVNQTCAELVSNITYQSLLETISNLYSLHQDCYQEKNPIFSMRNRLQQQHLLRNAPSSLRNELRNMQFKQAKTKNSVPKAARKKYLNQDYVRHALHIPDYIPPHQLCNENITDTYKSLYNDTTQFFQQLLDSNYPLRTLIYNGDLDAGAGHAVPIDRPGQMLQVLTNFIRQKDYNDISPFSWDRQPLLPQFTVYLNSPSTLLLAPCRTLIKSELSNKHSEK
ncbi:Carboxypeptidase [Dirofilaria immitis]|nr:Carboxypeptidase [Dirofilaria immitis]